MRVFCHGVYPATGYMSDISTDHFQHDPLIPDPRHEYLDYLTLVIAGPPEVVPLPVDFHEDLVEVPRLFARSHAPATSSSDLCSDDQAEPIPLSAYFLVAHIDAPFM